MSRGPGVQRDLQKRGVITAVGRNDFFEDGHVIITSGQPANNTRMSSTHDGLSATELRARSVPVRSASRSCRVIRHLAPG
jgi:hypothetical protein